MLGTRPLPTVSGMASRSASARTVQAPKARPGSRSSAGASGRPSWLTPRRMLAFALIAAVAIAGILIGVSATGSSGAKSPPKALAGAALTRQLFAGIPQNGMELGSPNAPVTMVEFADPACPYCMQYAVNTLPVIVQRYVRTGQVRLLYNGLEFVGPASDPALRAIQAAAAQNKGWNVLDLLYRNQGDERTNWATTSLL